MLAVSIRLLLSFLRSASLMNVGSVCSVHHRMISFLLSTRILWALRKVLNKRTSKWMNEIFRYTCLSSYDIPDIRVVLTVYGLGLLEWFFFFLNETFPGIKYYLFFAENDTVWADIARFACVITFYGHIIIYNSFIILSCQPGIHFIFLRWLRMFLWDSLNFNFKVCFSNDISNYFRGKNRCFNVSPYRRTILMYLSLLWPWMYLYG